MTQDSTQLYIRGISLYNEQNFQVRIIQESLRKYCLVELLEVQFQIVVPNYLSTLMIAIRLHYKG